MVSYPFGTLPYQIKPYDTLWALAQRYNTGINAISVLNPGLDINYLRVGQIIYICPGYKNYPPLKDTMRMLWEQHVVWTRLTIFSMVFGLPDVDVVTKRLLRNPKDFEAVLKPLIGEKNASMFADLFTSHLVIAAQLVKAAKAGDTKAAEDAEKKWYANADEIALFLGSINPRWSQESWKAMLHEHLALTKSEAVDLLTKKYAESIDVYDKIEQQALKMADMMAEGLS